jgi:isoleucyl-tRNA synthetase
MAAELEGTAAPSLPEVQRRIRAYWEKAGVPQAARDGPLGGPIYRFTEGPPTANGLPHIGHVVGRTLKDTYLRFRRMRGFRIVTPMAGWDCHGLPVELEIEKRHGIKSKQEIEAFGVEKFCEECRSSALETIAAWREMSDRLGYWLDYDHAYYTMAPTFIESVWWSLRQLFDRGLLEKGHYVLPYCPRCETSLSSHEVAQGYKEATDPSVTVRFRLDGSPDAVPSYLLVWTTTPWTLPANLLIAARADLPYVAIRNDDGSEYLMAEAAKARYFPDAPVRRTFPGKELEGLSYVPLFPFAGPGANRYRVVLDDMVTAADGTGFVHVAPSFGPDDERVGRRERVGMFDPLDSRGHFLASVPPVQGKLFKTADKILIALLDESGALVRNETLRHTYPFCWRCDHALLYRAIDSWFVRTSRFNAELVANNATVDWHPAHLRDGRFGNFLTEAKDWALSRQRFWGTPLPIWVCEAGHATCVGSFAELAERSGAALPAGFDPHRVTVDRITLACSTCAAPARREPYTIDGWYDSGSAPFAQYHYPFEPGPFDPTAANDLVAEGIDQTRGWFYTLLVIATALYHRPAYKVAVSNGHVMDATGRKMSKSKGNALDPMELLGTYGGDAVRWSFLVTDHTDSLVASEATIRTTSARTLGTLMNVVEFYRQNARLDGVPVPAEAPAPRNVLDRWLLSRLDGLIASVSEQLETYEAQAAALALRGFVDDLSTWYLRRSRPRFWSEEMTEEKRTASETLGFALATLARLMAPMTPYIAEYVAGEVGRTGFDRAETSVHTATWPDPLHRRHVDIEDAMASLRKIVEVGRELRQRAGVKSRIPLEEIVLVGAAGDPLTALGTDGEVLLREELNVRSVRRVASASAEEFPLEAWVLRDDAGLPAVALKKQLTPELVAEGYVREVLRRLQNRRKELKLRYADRVRLHLYASGDLYRALHAAKDRLRKDLQAEVFDLIDGPAPEIAAYQHWELDGSTFAARMEPATP